MRTIAEVRQRLAYWQKVLSLPEWAITVNWGSKAELQGDDGHCYWSPEQRCAQIFVKRGDSELEQTLIHEMLHIVIDGHRQVPPKYSEDLEYAINRLTLALYGLARS